VKRRDVSFLIDSGGDCKILSRRFAKKIKLNTAKEQFVYTANGMQVKILGSAGLNLFIDGQKVSENFLCTDKSTRASSVLNFLREIGVCHH